MASAPTAKAPAQRDRILALLRQQGPAGVTNLELNSLCLRYGARIFELRRMGFQIETRREDESIFRFLLVAEVQETRPLPTWASPRAPEQAALFPEAGS